MTFSKKEQWVIFCAINGILVSVILLYPLYDKYLAGTPYNRCNLLEFFHWYCPACGGTRAFEALINFDILSSLKYNPTVVLGAVVFIIYEVAMIKHLIKGGDREIFIKSWMAFAFLGFWFTYFIVRNVLLYFGIDLVGNVLV